jgi:preprotein translocase subunit SecG
MIQTSRIASYEKSVGGLLMTLFVTLAFLFIPASLIMNYVKERENNAKHQ